MARSRKAEGFCRICGAFGPLSSDHVPPQGCIKVTAVEIENFRKAINSNYQLPQFSQNGVKFKTICEICNSKRLGGQYDKEFKDFVNNVISYYRPIVESGLVLPPIQTMEIKGQRLARAIIGHLLAASLDSNLKEHPDWSPFDKKLSDYFLNINSNLPREIEIFYWLYPNRKHIILKNFGFCEMGSKGTILGHLIKFYPLAFWVTLKKPDSINFSCNRLPVEKCYTINEKTNTILNYSNTPAINWPENPTGNQILLLNQNQLVKAKERKRRDRKPGRKSRI